MEIMNINIKVGFICGLLFSAQFLNSCTDNWLAPDPLSTLTPENVYVDEDGFESLLVTMRKNLKDEHYGFFSWSTAEYVSSDLAVGGYGPDFSFLTPTGTPERYPVDDMFGDIYEYLKDPNVLISRIDEVKWQDQSVRNRLLAEAFWHRAYLYYRLIHSYGDVPWIGEELKGAKLDFTTHSRWTILDKIQRDLEWAVEWMPESAPPRVPTKYAGWHLLAKIYLANTEFDKAIEAATNVINGPFVLMTNRFGSWSDDPSRNVIWDLFRHENIHNGQNTETILGFVDRAEAPEEARRYRSLAANFNPHWWDVKDEDGQRGIEYPSALMDTVMRGQGITVSNKYYQYKIWGDENNSWETTADLRRSDINWIEMREIRYNVKDSPNFGERIDQRWSTPSDTTLRWFPWPHYKTYNPTSQEESTWGGGNGDWYLFRLAETYLIRAEAYYWNDQLSQAAADINKVRLRANASSITGADVTVDYIFDERARELYMEEPRHTELVRVSNIMARLNINGYDLESIGQQSWWYDRVMRVNDLYNQPPGTWWSSQSVTIEPYNIYWPIPQNIITANTQGTINQNYGYEGYQNNIEPLDTIEDTIEK